MKDKYECDASPVTLLLSYVGRKVRRDAYQYWKGHEYAIRDCTCMGEEWCFLWFRTGGCMRERAGSCIICKYGTGPMCPPEEIVTCLRRGIGSIVRNYDFLFVSSSGSMLDSREVPTSVFNKYLDILADTDHRSFGFETRCETVSAEVIRQCQNKLSGRLRQVFMGLEVANEGILKCCLNKTQRLSDFTQAIDALTEGGVDACVNVLVGIPFFSVKERIELAVQSVAWAFDHGASRVFLFPVNVKQHTPLAILHEEGVYIPPSLWELVEVMSRFSKEVEAKQLGVSWYRPHEDVPGLIHSPVTCKACLPDVLEIFDKYDRNPQFSFVEELLHFPCSCKNQWQKDLSKLDGFSVSRVMEFYALLARKWDDASRIFSANSDVIRNELEMIAKQIRRSFDQ